MFFCKHVIGLPTHLSTPLRKLSIHKLVICVIVMAMLQMKESEQEELVVNFLELVQTLLKDPEGRRDYFLVRRYHFHFF